LAQDDSTTVQYPSTKPIVKIYSNFHTGLNKNDLSTAFEIRRVYLGYKYQLDDNFSGEVKLDVGSPNDESSFSRLRRYAYFKTANLQYNKNKLTIKFGLISLYQFKLQEKFWSKRYIYKSFQDEHDFGDAADIGAGIKYQIHQNLSLDFIISNGEGYKKLQSDRTYKEAIGLTFVPNNIFKFRLYYDVLHKQVYQSSFASFVGIEFEDYKLGLEYNQKVNQEFQKGYMQHGFSTYFSWYILPKLQLFGRYDRLTSNIVVEEEIPWNIAHDGTAVIIGIEFHPLEQVKIALDYQDWYPWAMNKDNRSYLYLNLKYSL
jgi:hypothetical protein